MLLCNSRSTFMQLKGYEDVRFLPRPKQAEYASRGQLLTETENGDPCGYLVWGNGWPRMRVYQACIQHDARRLEHGLGLVRRLVRIAVEKDCETITLWCADD